MIYRTIVKSDIAKVRTVTVGEAGDLAAPPGSQPWAIAVRLQIQSLLKDNASNFKHLQTWLRGMEEYAGYRQLADESGQPFSSYAEFCNAKPPWGLGCPPKVIDRILKELESVQGKALEEEDKQLKTWGNSQGYLQRFSQLVQHCADNQPINTSKIGEVLDLAPSKAHLWRKRWLDLGWIELLPSKERGCYQITEEGRKVVKNWLEKVQLDDPNGRLWLTIPRCNSKKAAEQIIKFLEVDQLRELYNLLGESLNQQLDNTMNRRA